MNIKILTSYHKKCELITTDIIKPIQVGTAINGCIYPQHLHDNTGDNISEKNRMYCELTAQYWAWKNLDADYYGFMHYRRYFSFDNGALKRNHMNFVEMPYPNSTAMEKLHLSDDELEALIGQYDVISAEPLEVGKIIPVRTVYEFFEANHRTEDYDVLMSVISEKYPEFYATAEEYFKRTSGYFYNMYIMKKDLFFDYCEWLFDILAEHEKRRDFYDYNIMEYRVSGYLAERLWGVYLTWLKENKDIRVLEVPVCFFESTEENTPVKPAFAENNVPVVFAANDSYVPYLAVALKSLIENTSCERNYDIIVLHADITEENQARLTRELVQADNISLRFKNVEQASYKYKDYDLYLHAYFTKETYFRFFIQDIMPDYEKVVYLDSDLTLLADVAELYDTPMGENLLAAVKDADSIGCANGYHPEHIKYQMEKLKLKNPLDYFNSGVLVMNLAEMRKSFTVDELMEKAAEDKWQLLDQDVLNMLCAGRVKFLDMAWNVMMNWTIDTMRRTDAVKHAPYQIYLDYMESRKAPKIVHYSGFQKPWQYADCDLSHYFWQYARMTSFYEPLVACAGVGGAQQASEGASPAGNITVTGVKEPVYNDGLYVKLINRLNRIFPKGSRRRERLKGFARVFIK